MPPYDVLITGANGFLGSEIVRQATECGLKVVGLGRAASPVAACTQYIRADIVQPLDLAPISSDVGCVIHVAGLAHLHPKSKAQAAQFEMVNVNGTANMMQAAVRAGIHRFVLVSSVSVYGGSANSVDESTICVPETAYAASKLHAEQCAASIAEESKIDLVILRMTTLYGERGDPGLVAKLIRIIGRGRFAWIGNGSNSKSLLHRQDAARACLLAATNTKGQEQRIYNVSASPHTVREIVESLASSLGRHLPSWHIPSQIALQPSYIASRVLRTSRKAERLHTMISKWLCDDTYDFTRFEKAFGFEPHVALDEGLRREVRWFREAGLL